MAPHNVLVIYKEWVNSILCEHGIEIQNISELNTHNLLLRIYQMLTLSQHEADLNISDCSIQTSEAESIASLLRLLRADGIRTSVQPSDIVDGDFQAILELLWMLILHYGINQGQYPSHQRTTSIGTKLLLKWCSELLGGVSFDYRLSMTDNMEKDVLHNIINQVTNLVSVSDEPEPCDYHEAIADAERKLGVSSNLLRACDTQTENLAVTVYISLLRRKQELILGGVPPTRPAILLNQQAQASSHRTSSSLSIHNDKTQQVLKDIERQLDIYHNGFAASSPTVSNVHEVPSNSYHLKHQFSGADSMTGSAASKVPSTNSSGSMLSAGMPSPIARTHGSLPNETNSSLRIDLSALQQLKSKRSCSTSSSPRRDVVNGVDQTADFTALLHQLKQRKTNNSAERAEVTPSSLPDKFEEDEDDDRTSPKSAPNTDEGFGTFTKTTPRGKDSASEGSDDHTDCEVDHLTPEPDSITAWWDRIELPSMELTAIDSSLFKSVVKDDSLTRVEEGERIEMGDDELMCMIDSIGMNGIKATSGLASAQEMELRLLYILKERDDLVLSYHSALKELSKLTARMKDENQLLRQQLNMVDMSHNDIVLALEEQASDGRQLALGLQDDLTDTEVNILSRLREDKNVLEDRLAALEHQYNSDLVKWQKDIATYKSAPADQQQMGELGRENEMLKLQLQELRNMFDVTVSQTQDECSNYLLTIERLQQQMRDEKAPISDTDLEALATRHSEMVTCLQGENGRLQSERDQLLGEVALLRSGKEKQEKGCGTSNTVTDSGICTDSTELISRSMNTSLSQSSRGTETSPVKMAVKSTVTDDDAEVVALQQQVHKLEDVVTRGNLDCDQLQEQKTSLLDSHKSLSHRLGEVESQLQMTSHKLTTLQAIHELVLNKNESLGRELTDANSKLAEESANKARLENKLSVELEKSRSESTRLSADVTSCRQQLVGVESECAAYRQREVDMNAELTKLTLDRSNLQAKINSLNSDLVNKKAEHVSQSMRVQQLEATKSNMESQLAEFKQDSLELFKKLEEARQEKDEMSEQLSRLHCQLSESVAEWRQKLSLQASQHEQVKSGMVSELSSAKSEVERYRSDSGRLTLEMGELRAQLTASRASSERLKSELGDILRTAKLDPSANDVMSQLHDLLRSLLKETAEHRFTTTHFRSENGQLQLRVNQLESMNKSIEERNKILQDEVNAVQASLDDSYMSADAQLNLLDLSAADIMSISDASELRNYIVAAKRQVEMMQTKRAQSNLEYSRKIFEMEKLMKDKSRASSETVSGVDSAGGSSTTPCSTIDSKSAATDYAKLPAHLDMNSSSTLAASLLHDTSYLSADIPQATGSLTQVPAQATSRQSQVPAQATSRQSQVPPQATGWQSQVPPQATGRQLQVPVYATGNLQQSYLTQTDTTHTPSLPSHMSYHGDTSKQVPRTITDRSHLAPSKLRYIPPMSALGSADSQPLFGSQIPADISDIESVDGQDSLSLKVQSLTNRRGTSTPTLPASTSPGDKQHNRSGGAAMSAIEVENAALKAELDILNSDRSALHQHMEQQTVQHDVLNDTLDELERSLEEVCDSNKLLRDTLGDCNNFMQTNMLSEPSSVLPPRASRPHSMTPSGGSHSMTPGVRPHSVAPSGRSHSMTPGVRPHSVTPSGRSHSMTPGVRPHSVTPSGRSHSMTPTTPYSSTSRAISSGASYGKSENQAGWSSRSDVHMTSSFDFNKLQQTNVQNYSSLLHSDMNSKSPSRHSAAERKSSDLNHMIEHSLSKLSQVSTNPSPSLSTGYTSTPMKASTGSSLRGSSVTEYV